MMEFKNHPEQINTDPEGHAGYVLTDEWILAKNYRLPTIQCTDNMKFKKEGPSKGA